MAISKRIRSLFHGQIEENEDHKMIFVVNMDLKMGKGKQCAQVAHAALGLYIQMKLSSDNQYQTKVDDWLNMGQKKIVVKGINLQHIESIKDKAMRINLPTMVVTDAGCTQIPPGSKTVLAIFGSNEQLQPITGSLKLM